MSSLQCFFASHQQEEAIRSPFKDLSVFLYSSPLALVFSLEADAEHRKKNLPSRATFSDSSENPYQSKGTITMDMSGKEKCIKRKLFIQVVALSGHFLSPLFFKVYVWVVSNVSFYRVIFKTSCTGSPSTCPWKSRTAAVNGDRAQLLKYHLSSTPMSQ